MKYIVLSLVMMMMMSKNSYSQLELKIKEIIVSNITFQLSEDIFDEDHLTGFFIKCYN